MGIFDKFFGKKEKVELSKEEAASIFEQIGGDKAVEAAVDMLYEKLLDDPALEEFFLDIDMNRQRKKMRAFLTMALGGPNNYEGKDLRVAHARLVKRGLGGEHFAKTAGHLQDVLNELSVPKDIQNTIMSVVGGTKDAVLGG